MAKSALDESSRVKNHGVVLRRRPTPVWRHAPSLTPGIVSLGGDGILLQNKLSRATSVPSTSPPSLSPSPSKPVSAEWLYPDTSPPKGRGSGCLLPQSSPPPPRGGLHRSRHLRGDRPRPSSKSSRWRAKVEDEYREREGGSRADGTGLGRINGMVNWWMCLRMRHSDRKESFQCSYVTKRVDTS